MEQLRETLCNWLAEVLQRESCAHMTGTVLRIIDDATRGKESNLDAAEDGAVRQLSALHWGDECPPRSFFVVTYRTVAMPMTVSRWLVLARGGPSGLSAWPKMVEDLCNQFPARVCHPAGGWVVLSLCMYNHIHSCTPNRHEAGKFLEEFGTVQYLAPLCLRSEEDAMKVYDAAFVLFRRVVLGNDVSVTIECECSTCSNGSDCNGDCSDPTEAIAITTDEEMPIRTHLHTGILTLTY